MSGALVFSYNFSKVLRTCRVHTPQPRCWMLWEEGSHSLCHTLCRLKSACRTKGSRVSNTYHKFPLHETSTAEGLSQKMSQKSSTPEGKSSSLNFINGETEVDNLSAENQKSWWTAQPAGGEHSPPFWPRRPAPFQHTPGSVRAAFGRAWEDTKVKTLPLMTTGRNGRKTRQGPKYQTPIVPKEAILSILRMGWWRGGRGQAKGKGNTLWAQQLVFLEAGATLRSSPLLPHPPGDVPVWDSTSLFPMMRKTQPLLLFTFHLEHLIQIRCKYSWCQEMIKHKNDLQYKNSCFLHNSNKLLNTVVLPSRFFLCLTS